MRQYENPRGLEVRTDVSDELGSFTQYKHLTTQGSPFNDCTIGGVSYVLVLLVGVFFVHLGTINLVVTY